MLPDGTLAAIPDPLQPELPAARVKALPGTWLGIEASQEVGSDFVFTATQENLGKAGSLKLNYGGVSIKKKRRTIPKPESRFTVPGLDHAICSSRDVDRLPVLRPCSGSVRQ